jgi:hypothetical protein
LYQAAKLLATGHHVGGEFRIIRRAGVQRWQKLFQNLRSIRETELVDDFLSYVTSATMSNRIL